MSAIVLSYEDIAGYYGSLMKGNIKFIISDFLEYKIKMPRMLYYKFIDALTLSQNKQTKLQWIDNKGSYCVMGVLLHVLGVSDKILGSSDSDIKNIIENEIKLLKKMNKDFTRFFVSLQMMNDYGNQSFTELAVWIERNTVII